ncbi:YqaE/Pmp3 family membrane protein [bacterium]|nr:YqaE/Pmp3 family membrane protein [bacterium]
MRSILALICPPAAVLASGSRSDLAANAALMLLFCVPGVTHLLGLVGLLPGVVLTLLFFVPGVVHALSVVDRFAIHRQYDSVMRAMERSGS